MGVSANFQHVLHVLEVFMHYFEVKSEICSFCIPCRPNILIISVYKHLFKCRLIRLEVPIFII